MEVWVGCFGGWWMIYDVVYCFVEERNRKMRLRGSDGNGDSSCNGGGVYLMLVLCYFVVVDGWCVEFIISGIFLVIFFVVYCWWE